MSIKSFGTLADMHVHKMTQDAHAARGLHFDKCGCQSVMSYSSQALGCKGRM